MKGDSDVDATRKRRKWNRMKTAVGHLGLLVALMAYTAVGGMVFSMLERPGEEARLARLHGAALARRRALVGQLLAATPDAGAGDAEGDGATALERALQAYEAALEDAAAGGMPLASVVGARPRPPPARWSLTQAVFFASTVLTTVGYGHIAPLTFWGRAFCMLYALVGIPLTLTVIADMGRLLASAVSVLLARARRPRAAPAAASAAAPPPLPARCRRSLTVLAAVACMLLYMAAGAGLIRLWEDWSFFEGFYFCFITMTTIGFGDIVPEEAEYMMPCTLYILAGLALTSTIIELVRRQYAQSWRQLQALSGPLAESLRRLGESAALAGGLPGLGLAGLDSAALHRVLAAVATVGSAPRRNQSGGTAKARAEWEQAMAAVLREIGSTAPPSDAARGPVLQIVIYETTV